MANVLIAVSSYNGPFWGSKNTGVYWSELAHVFDVLHTSGLNVQLVSETGTAGLDEMSIPSRVMEVAPAILTPNSNGNDARTASLYYDKDSPLHDWQSRVFKASALLPRAEEFAAVFFVGGHGCCFDFPTAYGLQELSRKIYENGGVVGAVCHGPCAFAGMRLSNGTFLLSGKRATGFSEAGEEVVGATSRLTALHLSTTPQIITSAGGIFDEGPHDDPMKSHVVTDGRIVTGKNPLSARPTAEEFVRLIHTPLPSASVVRA